MFRLLVTALAGIGAGVLINAIFPSMMHVVWVVAGFGLTWTLIACLGVSLMTYRITK